MKMIAGAFFRASLKSRAVRGEARISTNEDALAA